MITYVKWIEVPFRITAELQKAEPRTWNYPGCPAGVMVENVKVDMDELKKELDEFFEQKSERPLTDLEKDGQDMVNLVNWVLQRYLDEIEVEAPEYE